MKVLISVLIVFSSILSFGQDPVVEQHRFSAGLNFSPNYSYRVLKYRSELQYFVDTREESEHASFGFNTGLTAQYNMGALLELELGLQYSRQTNIFKNVPAYDDLSFTSVGLVDYQCRYYYLEIPVRLNYRVLNKKVFWYVTGGVSLNIFLKDKTKYWLTYNGGLKEVNTVENATVDPNSLVYAVIGGVGAGYNITEKFNLRLEPLFRYSLTPLEEAPIDQHNYSVGTQLSLNIKL